MQFVSIAVLARLVDQSDFGLVTMSLAIIGIAAVVSDFGLSMAAIQSQTITQQQRSNLFWTNTAIGVALFLIALIAAPWIAAFYGEPAVTPITQVLAVTFLLGAVSAQFRAEVSIRLRFKWLAAADVAPAALALIVAILLALGGAGYWALVAQQVVVAALTLLVLVIAAAWFPSLPRRGHQMRSLYNFGANSFGVQVLTYVTGNIDSVLIGRVSGPEQLGVYDRAYRLFSLPLQQIAAPMTRVAMPILSKLQADARYEPYLHRAQTILGYAFAGSLLVLAGCSNPLIEVLLGPGWGLAKPIFAVLAIGGVFQGIGYVYYWIFLSRALTGVQLRWSVISRSLTVALMILGVAWGPVGVAVASTVGQALNWSLLTLFPMRRAGIQRRPLVVAALRPVLFFAPAAVGAWVLSWTLLSTIPALVMLAILLVANLAYAAVGALIPQIRSDYASILDTVKRLRR
ncbi:lipopolysaccharide biosynthesis protein [Microbacterium sp. LWH3-1.2]